MGNSLGPQDLVGGCTFKAKFIGTKEIGKPSCVEDVLGAMRKVRIENKINKNKKQKINLSISSDEIKVTFIKSLNEVQPFYSFHHNIEKVLYVSQDMVDRRVFSYIVANDHQRFLCLVFKSLRRHPSRQIVRVIGNSFEDYYRKVVSGPPGLPGLSRDPPLLRKKVELPDSQKINESSIEMLMEPNEGSIKDKFEDYFCGNLSSEGLCDDERPEDPEGGSEKHGDLFSYAKDSNKSMNIWWKESSKSSRRCVLCSSSSDDSAVAGLQNSLRRQSEQIKTLTLLVNNLFEFIAQQNSTSKVLQENFENLTDRSSKLLKNLIVSD